MSQFQFGNFENRGGGLYFSKMSQSQLFLQYFAILPVKYRGVTFTRAAQTRLKVTKTLKLSCYIFFIEEQSSRMNSRCFGWALQATICSLHLQPPDKAQSSVRRSALLFRHGSQGATVPGGKVESGRNPVSAISLNRTRRET